MYGYTQNTYPNLNSTYTTPNAAAAVAAAYSGSSQAAAAAAANVFGYAAPHSLNPGLDASSSAANYYSAYGYGTGGAASTAYSTGALAATGNNYGFGGGFDLTSAYNPLATANAKKNFGNQKNAALTTLTQANKGVSSTGYSYDAAVIAAASNLFKEGTTFPNKVKKNPYSFPPVGSGGGTGGAGGAAGQNKYGNNRRWGLGANANTHREPTQFYCEVCKISCAGTQTYKEHLEGKMHKKKELLAKGEGNIALPRSKVSFRCDLCNTTCTGKDTYEAHVRGSKHQRTLQLCKKLGKPIPTGEPTIIAPAELGGSIPPPVNLASGQSQAGAKIPTIGHKKAVVPVQFVQGNQLSTTAPKQDLNAKKAEVLAAVGSAGKGGGGDVPASGGEKGEVDPAKKKELEALLEAELNVKPVGEEFVESEKDANGKHLTYACKLCDCKFSDINAKDIHLKGRRHRLQYKMKVDSTLEVDIKPNTLRDRRTNKVKDQKLLKMLHQQGGPRGPPGGMPPAAIIARFAPPMPPRGYFENMRYMETEEDRHIMAKHAAIFPHDKELTALEETVQGVEIALKGVSDHYESSRPPLKEKEERERVLKGAMRIGVLSKGLMLKDEKQVELVALFSVCPTHKILNETYDVLMKTMKEKNPDVSIEKQPEEAALVVSNKDRLPRVKIHFTSPMLRQGVQDCDESKKMQLPSDGLPIEKCLNALAELRHAKWFQVRCTHLQSCQVVLRILRDIRRRVAIWKTLTPWMTELLVEKVIMSYGMSMGVGDALRRFFEAISTGVLFQNGPGISDPCEKDQLDALKKLTGQERENMTSSGQHALRLIAFGQIYKILGMEPLPALIVERKRPREQTGTSEDEAKKDKIDSEGEKTVEKDKEGSSDKMES